MPVPRETLAPRPLLRDDVLTRLRDAIVDGTLAPEERVRDGELAAWLGVSRTPVREALLELGRAGLVHTVPGRSTVIAPVDPASIRDARAVVAAMHAVAVRDAVPRLSSGDLRRMRAANAAFAEAQRRGQVDAALAADARFHAVAVDVCDNAAVTTVLAQYEPILRRAERLRFASHEGTASIDRHERLIALCEAGDAASAAALAEAIWLDLALEEPADRPHPPGDPS